MRFTTSCRSRCNPWLLAIVVAWSASVAGFGATLVSLDATQLPEGALNTWTNKGATVGNFTSAGSAAPQVVKAKAGKGVKFSGAAHYAGPVAPEAVTGDHSRTIEAWVYNPTAQQEETVFAWGRRGADAINCSFGHGTDPSFGAVGHWGAPDIGWEGNITFNEWTYIVYTYDQLSQTTTVYKDGAVANTETEIVLNTAATSASGNPLPFRVARQSNDDGSVSATGVGDITVGKVRVHDVALGGDAILAQYQSEVDQFIERDTDKDGMPDWWESLYPGFLNVNDGSDAAKDQDSDGLSNLQEYQRKTTPDIADTDGDGVKDGAEVNRTVAGAAAPTDPLKADSDGDGLSDGAETATGTYKSPQDTGTDPLKPDTDSDGYLDWQEVLASSDPNSASSVPKSANPLVLLDATQLPTGPLATWTNTGALPGNFSARTPDAAPEVTTVAAVKGVQLNGQDYYTGPSAPAWITGNGAHTVEAWVYNPSLADEETVFAWGRRGGPDGSNCSFNHGQNASYGAVGHWGSPDIGWDGNIVAGQWTHVTYSWEPVSLTQSVYKDGQLAATESLSDPLAIFATAVDDSPLPFRVASQNESNGAATDGLRGSMTIAKIAVYDVTLDAATIQKHFTTDAGVFGILDEDKDGMPTWYERTYSFLNPNDATDAAKDQDGDGLPNLAEYQQKTQPDNPDSDADGASDGAEINSLKTGPLVADSDQDGLSDGQEVTAGANPLNPDSDGDSFTDGQEVVHGSNPKVATSVPNLSQAVAIIDIDASSLASGALKVWTNSGALHGQFTASTPPPVVESTAGITSVAFDGTSYMTGPVSPTWMTGQAARTVEAWVYNPELADEETVFSWGRRGGPDGSNCAFNHGSSPAYGAVGHWGGADVGWNGKVSAGQWSHVAYTWDPAVTAAVVYSNGQAANTNVYTAGLDTWAVNDASDTAVPLTFLLASQHDANGAATEGLRGSFSVARLRVYDGALSAQAIAQIYNAESGKYTALSLKGITLSGNNVTITWDAAPGALYDVLATSALGQSWNAVATGLSQGTYTEAITTGNTAKFYRIRRQ